ncbi:hypothetical protein E8E12_006473 [Didymella heteroderae]|uniref:NFX1-type zinc finger-containing protein 1 n=1 Tax=Didymella heteroderae TaxID=1769908 RepID=A0A9P4WKA8_9PLEO|nr:hypothetical protein E8E12_006473 [Didymella heteroderae]
MSRRGGSFKRGNGRGRGQGRESGRQRNEGDSRQQATGVCRYFVNGDCKRKNCRFSHDEDTNKSNGDQRRVRVEETPKQQQARIQYNSWKRSLGQAYSPSDVYTMERVWQGAVNILQEDDRDWKQQLPRDLDKDEDRCNGRAHVKALLERRAKSSDIVDFVEVSKNFLEVITHPSLVDCLAVDEYVSGIYNFISGGNGTRAIKFFQHLCETMVAAHTDGTSILQTAFEQATTRLAAALYELLSRNRRARLHDDIDELVSTLDSAAEIIPASQPSVTTTTVKRLLADTRALIDRARGLIADEDSAEEVPRAFTASMYPRDIVIPAKRHDNDKLDISEITMFPTRDELLSDAKDFLPSTDPDQPHFLTNKIERHIDTNFRLYRHDVFGELKKALSGLLHAATDDPSTLSTPKAHLGDMRAYHYPNAEISYVSFEGRRGLQTQISFQQPAGARHRSANQRSTWWEESRRLEEGSLLSYIFVRGSVVQHLFFTVTQKKTKSEQEFGLADRESMATITAKLTTQSHAALETLINASCGNVQGVLLEFPNVLPATFVPILENLQDMQRLSRLRFSQWLLPDQHDGPPDRKVLQDIPPPIYARKADFKFPLSSIMKAEARGTDSTFGISATASCSDTALIAEIASKTTLDDGQCRALVAALTREFAFIQGPPGTGKSYIGLQVMRVLLEIKKTAGLGPIIVVCYTNHALDQFLEHLLQVGITKIIRVGGQSKSDLLGGHNLRDIVKSAGKTKNESFQAAKMYQNLEEHEKEANKTLGHLHASSKNADWKALSHHLARRYPKIHAQFQKTGVDGFTVVGRHPFDTWKPARSNVGAQIDIATADIPGLVRKANLGVHALTLVERRDLMSRWLSEIRGDALADLSGTVGDAEGCFATLNKVHDEADRRVLSGADVIGVTTSGLAKRISVLKHISSKVIICEEAGEVMEPHMLSALLPTVEHCIQIGDHEQLRPTINNFQDLSLESKQGALHSLDKSQFERLSIGERGRPLMPVAQLEVQRRMRPDVSTLIRETIYPKLIDHPSTVNLPDVVGMRKNVYWLNHDRLEDQKESLVHHNKSRSNEWEIDMVHALVRHIIRQGVYSSSEIAVLTPYTGQLQKLRAALRKDFEIILSDRDEEALEKDGFSATASDTTQPPTSMQNHRRRPLEKKQLSELLRIATVDNFQGEEAKIIVVSLVRSNKERNVGFLKTSNRINVLLSRAQHGMYLIGNVDTYSSVGMWQKVISMLEAKDSVGHSLALCCPRHVDKVIEIHEPDDFATASPEAAKHGVTQKPCMPYGTARCRVSADMTRASILVSGLRVQCGMRADEQPDLVMMLPYKDIDLDDTPIVVLGCQGRHFFTVETLDGIIGMKDVYHVDPGSGTYSRLKENEQLAPSIPQCPTCREPVRQYVTQRYNRLVNRAVIDEMSKRFVVSGQQELQQLSDRLQSVEQSLEDTRAKLLKSARYDIAKMISARYVKPSELETSARNFLRKMDERHKPSHRLYEAIRHIISKHGDLSDTMANMSLDLANPSKKPDRDQRITLGGRLYHLKVRQLALNDKFEVLRAFKSQPISFPGGSPIDRSGSFLGECEQLIKTCRDANSPKLAVEATLYYAHIARLLGISGAPATSKAAEYRETAKVLLEEAEKMCERAFQGRDQLRVGIEQSLRLLGREFYAEVTKEEIDAIKRAMVSGRGGIATHSGHWYNCENGHPFAIGECGMPMQLATCPECGAQVGGRSHQAVAGVTRAREMEG